ncbi:hypothetical protein L53_01175 [Hyphomonas sp. L-53-1-40]|nr:hypothetical protein L53_01175 [Hyphomonas sp. L-53-1-40]
MMLNAMATGAAKTDYAATLDAAALQGKRIGVLRGAQGSSPLIKDSFEQALSDMEAAGAILVDIDDIDMPDGFWGKSFDVLKYEFKATLNAYLASTPDTVTTRTLADLIAFNAEHADIELALFNQDIFEQSEGMEGLESESYKEAVAFVQTATREKGIDRLLAEYDVVALVAPSGPLAPRADPVNGDVYAAAIAGYPHLTVPMGTVRGIPIGLSFMGGKDQDAAILSLGYAYEQRTQARAEPTYMQTAEDLPDISKAMRRR